MKRNIYNSLIAWKNSKNRKPLVLYGARQVGKTYILKELGKNEYKNTLYLNFDKNKELHNYFADNISPHHIIDSLKTIFKQEINAETLLIFDEIQECQRAKDSLKYFNEEAPEYNIAAAGSFLGIASGKFPVGQVDKLTLYPMTFYEFLEATGNENSPNIHALATEKLKQYFYIGGMPEAVKTYAQTGDLLLTRQIQEQILSSYKEDFLKHIKGVDIPKVRMLWDSIPVHLAKEKKKFIYKEIKQGGRAAEFENALDWLVNTGLVYKISCTEEAKIPLVAYEERNSFKLYMLDIGLLAASAKLDVKTFFSKNHEVFKEFKGALAEQFVLQELKPKNIPISYWSNSTGKAEVDFVVQYEDKIIPIEVKSGESSKSKSLGVYIEKYNPQIAIRTSLSNYEKRGNLLNIPLYAIGELDEARLHFANTALSLQTCVFGL
ncbi:MAG: AAA family ATPase [Fibromonadaceae bacterium]|jgi:predicted AAA+ superfamily ATPase|nr:AAA family ATPase [Fibromonadaceae bacterium]